MRSSGVLSQGDPPPFSAFKLGASSPFLIVCDHAGVAVPRKLARLGLPKAAFAAHIASDLGVAGLAAALAARLGAGVIAQTYSRLVIDCNRAPGHRGSILAQSDGWPIPGNAAVSAEGVGARVAEIHRPYHAAIAAELNRRAAEGAATALVCLHSFTPILAGVARPWHVGVLHLGDSPLSHALLAVLRREPGLVVGDNQPYAMDATDFTAPHHAAGRAIAVTELEIRQDLIADEVGQSRLADLLARALTHAYPSPARREG